MGDIVNYELEDIQSVAELPYNWSEISDKTILISGGNGFIGSFISDVIRYRNKKYNCNTKIVSLSRSGGASDETVEQVKHDITEYFSYDGDIDYILHFASNTHPKQYGEDPVGTITTNVIGCDNLLKLAVEKKSKFILASSVEVYGQGCDIPIVESYCGDIDFNTVRAGYNEAKRTCEVLSQSYRQQYGVEIKIVRLARIIGANHKYDSKAMSQFLDAAVAKKDITLKSSGNQKYSYCYIVDAVSGIFKILFDGSDGEKYNVAGDYDELTLSDYAEYIAKLSGTNVKYQIERDNSVSKAIYAVIDTSKLKSIGWEPMYNVKDAIKRTYEIKRNNYQA